jgi:chromosome segregation ATPase
MAEFPNIFEGLKFESPLEAQERLRLERSKELAAQPNSYARGGYGIGIVLKALGNRYRTGDQSGGFFHRLATGDPSSPDVAQAKQTESILSQVAKDTDEAVTNGMDPEQARVAAMQRAATAFAAAGRGTLASQLQAQAMALKSQGVAKQAELDKLRAETREANAKADAAEGKVPTIQDPVIRLQNERDSLTSQLQKLDPNGPAFRTVSLRMDEINKKIQKEITIVGRTPQDVDPTKSTLTKVQETVLNNRDQLDQIHNFINTFNPDYYTFGGRIKGGILRVKDWIDDKSLTPDEKRELVDRTQNVQSGAQLLNAYIHAITGAQVGQAGEQQRLQKAIIDVEHDSPTVQEQKAKQAEWMIDAWNTRAQAAMAAGEGQNSMRILDTPLEQWRKQPSADQADQTREAARRLLGLSQ